MNLNLQPRSESIPKHIQQVLDKGMARDIAAYIQRRNQRHPHSKATLSLICRRFRLRQSEAIRVIESVPFLALSDFAYKPTEESDWGSMFLSSFLPVLWEDAPLGRRLVIILDENDESHRT